MTGTGEPAIRVLTGRPDDAELAAVTAVLLATIAGHTRDDAPHPVGRTRASHPVHVPPNSWRTRGRLAH